MSDPHFGLEKPDQESLTQPLGVQPLPLALLPTSQQGSPTMTRLATVGQGGRISVRSTPSNGVNDSTIATLLSNQSNSLPNLVSTLSSPRKRKLPPEEYVVLRRKVSESKTISLRRLQASYAEHCALLCFLQENGDPGDFSSWRSRLPPVPLTNFLHMNKLNPTDENEDLFAVLLTSEHSSLNTTVTIPKSLQVSTSTDASSKCISTIVNNVEKRLSPTKFIKSPTVVRTSTPVKNSSPQQLNSPSSSSCVESAVSSQEQIVEKAKQEAYVMQRIGELQRDGLWAEKRLPKVHELPRAKAHWDYLIEEMVWLAADFAQERKWKKAAAKKCARMVQKYFQEKEILAQKAIKAKEMQLKRIASCMAKEIKQFWANVEKLVEFKQQTRLEEKRKKALDQHLSFIVDQTEKYSSLVAESMNTSHPSSPRLSDDEFEPVGSSDDDEETIAREEALDQKDEAAINAEVDALKRESEIPLEELLSEYLSARDATPSSPRNENQDDEDFVISDKGSSDDEETIQEQEVAEGAVDYKKEIDELKAEGDMSIEELRAKYGQVDGSIKDCNSQVERESESETDMDIVPNDKTGNEEDKDEDDVDDEDDEEDNDVEEEEEEEEDEEMEEDEEQNNDKVEYEESDKEDNALKTLLTDTSQSSNVPGDKGINDVAAIAQSLQPKGNTLSSTSVVTKIPFLLKHTLREYQHIGLDWLVTMHDRKLNGILADEMGLGKTIQTIALLAHLACEKGNWGPHLIVVPTSVMLNWEMEFKKWCPAFKILTYYGTQKERKMKRAGWTKPNAFHVCITSYKLVIQDHQSFRRKKWKYLILDEAQNIKNFKSQRWQLLLNFQTQRRLLLTGTPLQNNLMELWSLMHFLMPNVFESHKEFKEWFSNPVTGMIEGNSEYNDTIIKRLHKVLRPFLLRRLKSEVETQMPKKYEHIVMCRLSNRQRYLYDDFMSRAKTKETLATGSLLSVINVLMQLRKVCNHPNLFEVRPTVSPFQMEGLTYSTASLVYAALDYDPFKSIDLSCLNLLLVEVERWLLAFVAHRAKRYKTPAPLIEEIDSAPPPPPPCPKGKIKIHVRRTTAPPQTAQVGSPVRSVVQVTNNHRLITSLPAPKVGTSPIIKTLISQGTPNQSVTLRLTNPSGQMPNYLQLLQQPGGVKAIPVASLGSTGQVVKTGEGTTSQVARLVSPLQFVPTPSGRIVLSQQGANATTVFSASGQRLLVSSKQGGAVTRIVTPAVAQLNPRPIMRVPPLNVSASTVVTQQNLRTLINSSQVISEPIPTTSASTSNSPTANTVSPPTMQIVTRQSALNSSRIQSESERSSLGLRDDRLEALRKNRRKEKLRRLAAVNDTRCQSLPIYGVDLVSSLRLPDVVTKDDWRWTGSVHCRNATQIDPRLYWNQTSCLSSAIHSIEERVHQLADIFSRYVLCVPAASAPSPKLHISHPAPWKLQLEQQQEAMLQIHLKPKLRLLHPIASAMSTQFPDPRLIQYDCGKLQSLDRLLRRLKSEHHRALIFTQMTRMLDVLEAFLNFHGHIYLRLDGTTKVDQRQVLMDRFNNDRRIFCFILSTRSGGVGVNLTGADTVIFYDSDWNPTMDAQAQDRCHRIGQTRDVHIYRLVSEKTVEENILKKANQKRMLGDIAIEGGNFTTAYFKSSTIQDLFNVDVSENDASSRMAEVLQRDGERRALEDSSQSTNSGSEEKAAIGALESALAQAEDETDVAAAKVAKAEAAAELAEFDENIPLEQQEGQELSKAETELNALMQQLTGVERYAMKFVEETESAWSAEQLAAAEAEIEQQKREWELGRLAALRDEECERKRKAEAETEDMITYSGTDARNQVWVNQSGKEIMPMWCPPTPPQDDSDVYIDHALGLLYEQNVMSEAQLPPVFVKKDKKRTRIEAGLSDGRHQVKVRQREDTLMHAPRSLFDRPTPALIKMRQELRLQRYRGLMRPSVQNLLKPQLPVKPLPEPEHVPDWVVQEDWTILQAIQQVQEMTLNLVVLSPGHTPNWDMVADMVNMTSRTYRSPKQCRNRYESVIVPREEGKIVYDSPKKQKKNKAIYKLPQMKSGRPLRTSQLYQQDNNSSMTQVMNSRFDAIRSVSNRRAPTVKPLLVDPAMKNPKHAEVLADCSIDYDKPLAPVDVATKRADRIAKEKQAAVANELAVLRLQQQQLQNTPKSSNSTSAAGSSPATSQASTSAGRQVATLTVQEMVAGVSANRAVVSSPSNSSPTSQQRTAANLLAVQTASAATTPSKGAKSISPAQLQVYRQQAILRHQIRVLQSRGATSTAGTVAPGAKVSVAVSGASQTQRVQPMKPGGVARAVTESEMVALIKRQQAAKGAANSTLTSAQILAQANIQTQQTTSPTQVGQVATLVKTVPATSLPVAGITLPQMKAALGANVKTGSVTTQQIRQLSFQHPLLAQQRKIPQQKITQLSQVAGKSGAPAQLIVQSQKSMPANVTVQQIQQVMKHHVVVTGGSSAGTTRTSVPSVTLDASGRPTVSVATALAGAIKAGSSAQQQAILTQVSAVLQQQGQPITVRQPVRIQTTTTPLVAVAVSQAAPTVLTLPPNDNTQSQ